MQCNQLKSAKGYIYFDYIAMYSSWNWIVIHSFKNWEEINIFILIYCINFKTSYDAIDLLVDWETLFDNNRMNLMKSVFWRGQFWARLWYSQVRARKPYCNTFQFESALQCIQFKRKLYCDTFNLNLHCSTFNLKLGCNTFREKRIAINST